MKMRYREAGMFTGLSEKTIGGGNGMEKFISAAQCLTCRQYGSETQQKWFRKVTKAVQLWYIFYAATFFISSYFIVLILIHAENTEIESQTIELFLLLIFANKRNC